MPTCYFTEKLCGPHVIHLFRDIERVIETTELWTAMATDNYQKLEDFIFERCEHKGDYSGYILTFILGQFHIIAQIGYDSWATAVKGITSI